jgi:HK97 family phage major capsid protein
MTSKEMREKRARLFSDARVVLDAAKGEGRAMSADEVIKYDAIMADADQLKATIDRAEAMEGEEARARVQAREGIPAIVRNGGAAANEARRGDFCSDPEYRRLSDLYIRSGVAGMDGSEYRALSIGTDGAGGFTVPDEFEQKLLVKLYVANVMRGLATVITTNNGTREIPVAGDPGAASWASEAAAFSETDESFTQVTIGAHKITRTMKVSEELIHDSAFDLEGFITGRFAYAFGVTEEVGFIAGTGAGQPTGVLSSATAGPTFAGVAAITSDELLDVYYALGRQYRLGASWLFADGTAKALRKLKNATTGDYMWAPGLNANQPDTLLGRPVNVSDNVPAMLTGNKSVLFGDFSYYWIADRQQTVIQRLNELYAVNGQVGFRGYRRVDGKLTIADAIVYGKQA